MTLPVSGPLSLGDVLAEIRSENPARALPIALGDADVRALAGKPSGAVSLSDLYGKASYTPMTVTALGGSDFANSQFGPGTASASATGSVSGGKGAKTYAWVVISTYGNPVIAPGTTSCSVSKAYTNNSNGEAGATLRLDVQDATGAVASSPQVNITLRWDGNL